jgi:NADPH2:quinone reductase
LKDRAQLKSGETLVVLGAAGGVGLAAVEIGHVSGARVIACASSGQKLELAKAHGADDGLVYPAGRLDKEQQKALSEDIKRLTGGNGADVLYDPVGGDYAEPALRAMNWGGRYLVIGFAAGEIPRVPLNLALLKGSTIVGVFWGAFVARDPKRGLAELGEITRWIGDGRLKPHISARIPLTRAGEAIRMLMDRKAEGKVVVIP